MTGADIVLMYLWEMQSKQVSRTNEDDEDDEE